jgi:F-type H+-transporting ATPase subunit delta
MRDRKVAARYARAFFEDALARQAVDEAAGDLARLEQVWKQNPELVAYLSHPLMPPERKRELAQEHLGESVHTDQMRFLELLMERRRVELLPEICEVFAAMVDDHQGIVRAEVRSAVPMTQDETGRLTGTIAALFGGTPELATSVHPELIGGVTVRVKDSVLDGSVRTSLDMLAADLRAVKLDVSAFEEDHDD